jgi:hypothetical protein
MEVVIHELRESPLNNMHGVDPGGAFRCCSEDWRRGSTECVEILEIHGALIGVSVLIASVAAWRRSPCTPDPEAEWCGRRLAIANEVHHSPCFAEDHLLGIVRRTSLQTVTVPHRDRLS